MTGRICSRTLDEDRRVFGVSLPTDFILVKHFFALSCYAVIAPRSQSLDFEPSVLFVVSFLWHFKMRNVLPVLLARGEGECICTERTQ